VRITVKGGECGDGIHKIGQEFTFERTTPGGMCPRAWDAISPYLIRLSLGDSFPWEDEDGLATISCPHPGRGITLELRRIAERDA
jgi:uncharacterized repeat protein (TIGR04076 family)